jgi:hypothetical protein
MVSCFTPIGSAVFICIKNVFSQNAAFQLICLPQKYKHFESGSTKNNVTNNISKVVGKEKLLF